MRYVFEITGPTVPLSNKAYDVMSKIGAIIKAAGWTYGTKVVEDAAPVVADVPIANAGAVAAHIESLNRGTQ